MAPRPPLLRRPAVTLDDVIAKRRKAPSKPTSFPLLPATAAAFLLLGFAQLAFWWWESRLPYFNYSLNSSTGRISAKEAAANPFIALNQKPKADTAAAQMREVQHISAPTLPQNVQFGDALARVTVTIFTDPSCGPCREKVRAWTSSLPAQGVRIVYKFWPQDPARTTPGLLLELARRQGEIGDFWRAIQGAGAENLDDLKMLTMLDQAGLPLAEQRTSLTNDGVSLMTSLEPDIATAKEARLPPPPVLVVDDYVLDGKILSPEGLGGYVQKRLEGRQIFENDDLFLMKK